MSTSITLNGVGYTIPAVGEDNWGTQVSNYLVALSTGVLSKAGGAFTLTADADFGASFGLKAAYYKSRGTVATTGVVRLANAESISWRNAANSTNYTLGVDSNNRLVLDTTMVITGSLKLGATGAPDDTLHIAGTNGRIVLEDTSESFKWTLGTGFNTGYFSVYDGTNQRLKVKSDGVIEFPAYSTGLLHSDSSGILTSSLVVNADVHASAAIAVSKLAAITASRAVVSDGSGFISAATTTSTQIGYLSSATGTTGTTSTNIVFSTSPTLVTPNLGTPSAAVLTNATGLPVATGISGLGTGVATFLATPSSANLASAVTDETGSGALVFGTSPTIASPTVTGTLLLQNPSGAQPELHLSEDPDNGTNVVKIKAPAILGADYTLTLPTDDGSANQVLSTDGSGVLSWASPFTNPMTTTGDIVYSSDNSGTPARLAVGAATTVLTGGTTPAYAQITNSHVDASAAIAYSKLSLTGSIVNADISGSAAIAGSKLVAATDAVAGAVTTSAQNISGVKTFYDGIKVDEAAGQSTLNHYSTTSISSVVFSGAGHSNSSSLTVTATRIGNVVTLKIPSFTCAYAGAGSSTVLSSGVGAITGNYAPSSNIDLAANGVLNNNAATSGPGIMRISAAGTLSLYRDGTLATAYANANAGLNNDLCITYTV